MGGRVRTGAALSTVTMRFGRKDFWPGLPQGFPVRFHVVPQALGQELGSPIIWFPGGPM